MAQAGEALVRMPEDEQFLRNLTFYALGIARRASGDLAGAVEALKSSGIENVPDGSPITRWIGAAALGDIQIMQGHLHQAAATFKGILTTYDGNPLAPKIEAFIHLGDLHREWNDLHVAERLLRKGLSLAERVRWEPFLVQDCVFLARWALARIEWIDGKVSRVSALLGQAETDARGMGRVTFLRQLEAYRARLKLLSGDTAAAIRWAAARGYSLEDDIPFEREQEYLTWARTLTAQGLTEEAIDLLDRLIAGAEAAGRLGHTVEMLALQALAYWTAGKDDQAQKILSRALLWAEPEGYVRTFVDEGRPMAALLHQTAARGFSPGYTRKLLAAFTPGDGQIGSSLPGTAIKVEPLSERELEVLQLLAAGGSNRDIAAELSIALTTAKKHVSNILHKLGASNRTEVVTCGRDLGLLS